MAAEESQGALFDDCFVSLVESKELPLEHIRELSATLQSNGAVIVELKADGGIKIDEVSHIISATSDFPDYTDAVEHMVPVVKKTWVRDSLLKNKLAPVRPYSPDPLLIFSGVTVTCADIPNNDKDAIVGGVMAMGGLESKNLARTTTHIVALSEDHPAVKQAKIKKLKCKVVLPHWFDDCLKLGKRIDEKPYTLPDPEIILMGPDDPLPVPANPEMAGATSARPDFVPRPLATDTRRLNVFSNKKVMLAKDLALNGRLLGVLQELIEKGDGALTDLVEKCDMLICHFRDGDEYVAASKLDKQVGNLAWLFYLITYNRWTDPLRKLLHYPIPRDGIEGFENTRITISNYGGEARIYLENLIAACGAEFTKSMRQDNTHLITARDNSEKCDAARDWGVSMVNHLWIEESYAKGAAQSLTNQKYIHFPGRTNLGEVIGQTPLDAEILRQTYLPYSESTRTTPEPSASPTKQRDVMADKNANVVMQTTEKAPEDMETDDESIDEIPNKSVVEITAPAEPEPVAFPTPRLPRTRKSASTTPAPRRTKDTLSTPANRRLRDQSKENETPSSTSSRGAKDRAMSRLHDAAADIALYEKEKKRKSDGVWGGRRAADQFERERSATAKRRSSVIEPDTDDEGQEVDERAIKKAKTTKLKKPQMKLLITGYKKWVTEPGSEQHDKKKLRELGIQIVETAESCNYICAPALVRTQKFLCALANGVTILNSQFIDTCLSSGAIPNPNDFILVDKANEKRFGVNLATSVAKAQSASRRPLDGFAVYCTEGIPNGPETYRAIVEANGGEFSVYKGKGTLREREDGDGETVYLLTGLGPKDRLLWKKFEDMAKKAKHVPRIAVTEWLLDAAMLQEVRWKEDYNALTRG